MSELGFIEKKSTYLYIYGNVALFCFSETFYSSVHFLSLFFQIKSFVCSFLLPRSHVTVSSTSFLQSSTLKSQEKKATTEQLTLGVGGKGLRFKFK